MLLFHTENLPHYGLDRVFELAKGWGFDGIELEISHRVEAGDKEYLKKIQDRHDIEIKALTFGNQIKERHIKMFELIIADFSEARVNLVPVMSFDPVYKNWVNDRYLDLEAQYQLATAYRNVLSEKYLGFIPTRSGNSLEALSQQGEVCLDLTTTYKSGIGILEALEALDASVTHVYLSNVYRELPYANLYKGNLPLESFLNKLSRVEQPVMITYRIDPLAIGETDPDKMELEVGKALKFYREFYKVTG